MADRQPFPGKHSEFESFDRYDFVHGGRDCIVVRPRRAARGRPWIWRTEFFGHEPQADVALLGKGFHVVWVDMQNLYGGPAAMDIMDAFYAYLTQRHGLARQVVLEAFSRGGLFAFNWAARNPGQVAGIYADAAVCDFKSWPAGQGAGQGSPEDWARCLQVYGLTEAQALQAVCNPVDNLQPLAAAGIPLLHVVGDADVVVPVAENTAVVERRYRQLGGPIEVIHKPGVDHHPHSLTDPAPIVAFVLRCVGATPLKPAAAGRAPPFRR